MVVGGRELIDTLWNVNNAPSVSYSLDDTGINRYIMECKLQENIDKAKELIDELIDTLWNVNGFNLLL